MSTTFDEPARDIKPPGPDPPADAAPPPTAGWLARACCRVAGHTGDWTYPDERCVRVRMCRRCGAVTSKQEHAWSAFGYLATDGCDQERRCDWCGAVESRVLHSWGPWRYVGPDNFAMVFRQFRTCGRCGAKEHLGLPSSPVDPVPGPTRTMADREQTGRAV